MKSYLSILVALFSTASIGLAQAPHAAIVTGEVHNPLVAGIVGFHHEPLLAPGPSQHHIVLDEQNQLCPALESFPKESLVTGFYKGEDTFVIPFFVEPGDSLHAVVTFAECRRKPILRRRWNLTVWTVPKMRPLPIP